MLTRINSAQGLYKSLKTTTIEISARISDTGAQLHESVHLCDRSVSSQTLSGLDHFRLHVPAFHLNDRRGPAEVFRSIASTYLTGFTWQQ